jgi:hypothetical protein
MNRPPQSSFLLLALAVIIQSPALFAVDGFSTVEKPWETAKDPVARMWRRWQSGEFKPDLKDAKAYAASVLKELKVSAASQTLVFSKTSLQNSLINPQSPRSVFFNDECYVGWAQGGMMELIGMDPENGPQFYALTYPSERDEKPALLTTENCLSCHEGSRTGGVKGLLVRSVYTDEGGQPILSEGSFVSGHDSPISERWGGWYVTGKHGKERHMGNVIAHMEGNRISLNREEGANVSSLNRYFSIKPYLAATSDIVALMVLEHQCTMHNKLTDAGKSAREAMARQHDLQKAFKEPITEAPQGSALTVINSQAEKVVRHLLFCEEYALTDRGIEGSPAYQEAFRSNRLETSDGRSLKDFQLLTRLFKYRCSYMIYSSGFEALPAPMKKVVYQRLYDVLSGKDKSKDFVHLSDSERKNIREILLETKKDLPDYWKQAGGKVAAQ